MSRSIKILLVAIIVLAVVGAAAWGGWRWFSRQALPRTSGTVRVAGLTQPVEIVRDQYGVPHIYADTTADLFFAEGYVHAQERFWQMDFWRHIGSCRLSEMFGESQLDTDKFLRTMGWRQIAAQEYADL